MSSIESVQESAISYRHEDDAVYALPPLFGEHDLDLIPEDRCADAFVSCSFAIAELLRFRECDTDQTDADGEASCDPLQGIAVSMLVTNTHLGFRAECNFWPSH